MQGQQNGTAVSTVTSQHEGSGSVPVWVICLLHTVQNMHISLAVDSNLSVVVSVSANGCLCVCVNVVVNRQPVRGVPRDG